MEDEWFNESKLFTSFESSVNGEENLLSVSQTSQKRVDSSLSSELDLLKQENEVLKKILRTIASNPHDDEPLANILYYSSSLSRGTQSEFEDFISHVTSVRKQSTTDLSYTCSLKGSGASRNGSVVCDGFALAFSRTSALACLTDEPPSYDKSGLPLGCIQYFNMFCIDKFGSEQDNIFPSPPNYERVYFKALPDEGDNGSRTRVKRKASCFNCDGDHLLNDCPKRRDLARISMKRKEFLESFSSPFKMEARYHADKEREAKFQHILPGKISQNLRDALGLASHDIPPFIYRMRMLGYPPGWLPSNRESGIAVYGTEGKEEQNDEDSHLLHSKFVHFPGFNVPVSTGVRDLSYEIRLPMMDERNQLNVKTENDMSSSENMNSKHDLSSEGYESSFHGKKRPRISQSENDMEIDDDSDEDTRLIAMNETDPCQSSNDEKGPILSKGNFFATTAAQKSELEDGEIPQSPGTDQNLNDQLSWWLSEPLIPRLVTTIQDILPPPFPLRPLPLHKISQILPGELNHISFEDRSRWLDPIFGNLQVRTGRYDKLKTILAGRESKRKRDEPDK